MKVLVAMVLTTLLAAGCFGGTQSEPELQDQALGVWLDPVEGEVPAINLVQLMDGRVLYWSGVEGSGEGPHEIPYFVRQPYEGESRIFDPRTGKVTTPIMPGGGGSDLFCSGQTVLPDGRILTAGGSDWTQGAVPETVLSGSTSARVFDPTTDTWVPVSDMLIGRWYPSLFTNSNGEAVAASGIGDLTNPNQQWALWESYRADEDQWYGVEATDQVLPLYPRVAVLPGGPFKGETAYNTVGSLWGPFGEHPDEADWSFQHVHNGESWTQLGPSVYGARQHANTVMLPLTPDNDYAPKFLTFGGTLQRTIAAVPLAEINDWSTNPPTNTAAANMHHGRWHANGVLLPDGTVLAVGGGMIDNVVAYGQENIPILPAERFDPVTGEWQLLANMSVPRMYHSSAVLLADGSVLVGGHVPLPMDPGSQIAANEQVVETRLEMYQPPYMFQDRPVLRDVPAHADYGQSVEVYVQGEQTIAHFLLVRPGATTHAFDSNQRMVQLEYTRSGNYYDVTLPPDADVTAPGPHMLFAVAQGDEMRVPSEAAWITIGS